MTAKADNFEHIAADLTAPGAPFELATIAVDGVPARIYRNGPQTLADIYAGATGHARSVFTIYEGQHATYGETLRKAAALSRTLAALLGQPKGARVAIVMANRPEWMIAFIAITALGATAVAVNSRGTAAEIAAALADTDARLAIADIERARLIDAGRFANPLLVVRNGAAKVEFDMRWQCFEAALSGWEFASLRPAAIAPDDEAVVMFTSGTTGGAKGALLTHRSVVTGLMNIQFSMAVVGARLAARYSPRMLQGSAAQQPSALLCMPLFHTSGCYAIFLSQFMRGGRIVVLPKWNAQAAVELIEREKIQAFSGSPTMLWDLLRVERSGRNLSSLVSLGVGGQALQPQLLREIHAAFPQAVLGVGYGMTEANGSVCQLVGDDLMARPSSSGRALPTAEMKIVDADGRAVATGEIGEIWLRGAMLMRGYCKRDDATAATFDDGWLKTGDLGRLDDEGFLHVVDRKKDIVISGGENISCTEVEGAALDCAEVREVAAFGVPDERLGERLMLAVVPAAAALDGEALKRHIGARLALYKVPRDIVVCDALPRNALGKVDREALRRQLM